MSLLQRTLHLMSPETTVARGVIASEALDPQVTVTMRAYDEGEHSEMTVIARMPMDRARELAAALNRVIGAATLD